MPDSKYTAMLIIFAVLGISLSCGDISLPPDSESGFYVTVYDNQDQPLEGVNIYGGYDWYYFNVTTDNSGNALLPDYARGLSATFRKSNYFIITVDDIEPGDYVLNPTPCVLTEIGEVEGEGVRFESGRVITVNQHEEYRVYSFDDNDVTEEALVALEDGARNFRFQRDTLWFWASGGIYAYYIIDIFDPQLVLHLDLNRSTSFYDWDDTLLAVGSPYYSSSRGLVIYAYNPDGSNYELYRLDSYVADQLFFLQDYLVVLGFDNNFLSVFDVSDPSDVTLSTVAYLFGPESSFLWGDTLGVVYKYNWNSFGVVLREFSNPLNPHAFADFVADAQVAEMLNDTLAIGRYFSQEYGDGYPCILMSSIPGYFQTVAILSENEYLEHHGADPPYFLIGGRLWKMEER